jgi:hypothetical protein
LQRLGPCQAADGAQKPQPGLIVLFSVVSERKYNNAECGEFVKHGMDRTIARRSSNWAAMAARGSSSNSTDQNRTGLAVAGPYFQALESSIPLLFTNCHPCLRANWLRFRPIQLLLSFDTCINLLIFFFIARTKVI